MSIKEIRSRTGISRRTISLWKKQWSVNSDPFPSIRGRERSSSNRHGRRAYDQRTRTGVLRRVTIGMPLQEISDETGVSLCTIETWRREVSLLPTNPARGVHWSYEIRSRVSRMLACNVPAPEIKEKTGVPLATIYRWRREDEAATELAVE